MADPLEYVYHSLGGPPLKIILERLTALGYAPRSVGEEYIAGNPGVKKDFSCERIDHNLVSLINVFPGVNLTIKCKSEQADQQT